jgi:alpha-beta hydrolase superfamily lysophospholipase
MGTGEDTTADAPVIEDGTFSGSQGRRIHWKSWSPAGDQQVHGAVTIAHGFGDHLGRYDYVARRLVFEGYAVFALDHHGHGQSEGRAGRIDLTDAVADLDHTVLMATERQAGKPQFLLGHSLGGLIALRYAIAHQDRLDGLVLSGPLAAIDGGPVLAAIGKFLGSVAPPAPTSKVNPKWVSRDPAIVAKYITDPLVFHRAIPAATAREMLLAVQALPETVKQITVPTLLMYGTADRLCPPRGAMMLADRIGSEDLTSKAYENLYHEILNEPERDLVLDEVVSWLDLHLATGSNPG